jgi:hypothetical protein
VVVSVVGTDVSPPQPGEALFVAVTGHTDIDWPLVKHDALNPALNT